MAEEGKNGLETEESDNRRQDSYVRIKRFHLIVLIFLSVLITAAVTTFILSFGDEKVADSLQTADGSEFAKLYATYNKIKSQYVGDVDEDELIEGAVNGMVEALGDPYSDYMTEEEAKAFNETIRSSFEGIGAQIEERDNHIVIVAPIKGSPAEKVGLQANDIILEVDGKNIQGMSSQEAVNLIRGKKGTIVELTIRREGVSEPIKVKITRDVIPIETVYSKMVTGEIGLIQVSSFSERTMDEFREHLEQLEKNGMKALILDLRYNPGGLLDQAVEMASLFVPNGKILYQMEYKDGSKQRVLSSNKKTFEKPVAVIVNGGSASASEIVAAALKESAGIPIVGEKTFGKGTAQTNNQFKDGSSLKLTTAKWLTPNGTWIHEKGLKPDYPVSMPEYASLPYVDPDLTLEENSRSSEVETIEKMLQALGYNPGTLDGYFDGSLKQAVSSFQKDMNLEANGVVHGETTEKLMEALNRKLEREDPQIEKAVEILQSKLKK
jgi:C-terminal peptidase (prc)